MSADGHQAEQKAAMCPGGQEGQQPPGLHQAQPCQLGKGGDPSPMPILVRHTWGAGSGPGLPSVGET